MMEPSDCSVLLVTPTYPPVLGGSEVEAQRVCATLRKRGYRMEVACGGGGPMPTRDHWRDEHGTPIHIFGHTNAERRRAWTLAAGVSRLLAGGDYNIVYFLMTGIHLAVNLPVARWRGIPILMKFSGSNTIRPLTESALGRLELRMLSRWANRILVLNPAMREEAIESGLPAGRLDWMPNPVDPDVFVPLEAPDRQAVRSRLGRGETEQIILYVGRLAPEKRLESLLEGFEKVAEKNEKARLVLVGDGPLRPSLEQLASRGRYAARVTFTGAQPMDRVREWMQISDVFALVSEVEGLPCSLIEAMATGMVAVVSDIPANTQLISEERGGVAAVGDVEGIAFQLAKILSNPTWVRDAGPRCRSFVLERFSSTLVADRYEALFSEMSTRRQLCGR